jgi:hypothetical protein
MCQRKKGERRKRKRKRKIRIRNGAKTTSITVSTV